MKRGKKYKKGYIRPGICYIGHFLTMSHVLGHMVLGCFVLVGSDQYNKFLGEYNLFCTFSLFSLMLCNKIVWFFSKNDKYLLFDSNEIGFISFLCW